MSEISLSGPNRFLQMYKLTSHEMTKITDEEPTFVKRFRDFLPAQCFINHSWNEKYDDTVYPELKTDGKIMALCTDKG